MSFAAMAGGPRMTELLFEHGIPIAHTAALQPAARFDDLDTMQFFVQNGKDVKEVIRSQMRMHFAATTGQIDPMKLLEHTMRRAPT
jgi:hypothetical protein